MNIKKRTGDKDIGKKDKFGTKGWFTNHKLRTAILAFIALVIIVSATGSGTKNKSSNTSTNTDAVNTLDNDAKKLVDQQASAQQSKPVDTHPHFGDGTFKVGTDIQPGTYRTRIGSVGCYYERMKDFSNGVDSILDNDNTDSPAVVTILATDAGFKSSNCGTWTQDVTRITKSQTSFSDGIYIVGTDIQPGTYKSSGETGCYWERMANFTGGIDTILANDNTDSTAIVTISATDAGFKSSNCGTWSLE
jgi:hypothetical protein